MSCRIQEEREERHKYKGIVKTSIGLYESEDPSNKRKGLASLNNNTVKPRYNKLGYNKFQHITKFFPSPLNSPISPIRAGLFGYNKFPGITNAFKGPYKFVISGFHCKNWI